MGFPGLPTDHVWYPLGRFGWANVDWCEATVAGYVTEPANTWSNLAYIVIGAILFAQQRKNPNVHPLLKLMPWAMVALGFLSGFYHATNAWITQLGDFIGMYLVAAIPFLLNLERMGMKKVANFRAYMVVILASTAFTVAAHYSGFPIQLLFGFFFGGIVIMELMQMRSSPARGYTNFVATLIAFAIAGTFSILDVTRTMCDPHDHYIQGHALWHYINSVGIYFAYHYCLDLLNPRKVKISATA